MNIFKRLLLITAFFCNGAVYAADDALPLADIHLHYNADQAEVIEAGEVMQILHDNNVAFGIVSSRPPGLAADLAEESGGWLVPFFMPYLEPDRKADWFFDDRVLAASREALASGRFKGLGEMHLIVGFAPSLKKHHEVIDGMLELAAEYDVVALIHAEASNYRYFLPLCLRHPQAKILWAHAGSVLPPEQVGELMRACPNVWIDMSARDHMRYGQTNPIVGDDGHLLPGWNELILAFQDRVLVGSDPYYYEGDATWDTPNTGWNFVTEIISFHRRWLAALPREIQVKLTLDNALNLFGKLGQDAMTANPVFSRCTKTPCP